MGGTSLLSIVMKQPSFSDLEYDHKKKVTRRERFLQEMDLIVPWSLLVKPIKRAGWLDGYLELFFCALFICHQRFLISLTMS